MTLRADGFDIRANLFLTFARAFKPPVSGAVQRAFVEGLAEEVALMAAGTGLRLDAETEALAAACADLDYRRRCCLPAPASSSRRPRRCISRPPSISTAALMGGSADGDVVVPLDAVAFGFWLKAAFGDPTTTSSGPYTHDVRATLEPHIEARIAAAEGLPAVEYVRRPRRAEAHARVAAERLATVDAVLMPTVAVTTPRLEEVEEAEAYARVNMQALRNTSTVNSLSLCAITLPAGGTLRECRSGSIS
jgi:Asp-tRNA(Asn)/Glu-tRNA(Gln) amidotransferase A subunit family amidase